MYKKVNYLTDLLNLRDDGTTSAGNWIYVGQWTEKVTKPQTVTTLTHQV